MAKKPLPTPETLRQLLRYEPETGRLFWRTAPVALFPEGRYSADRRCKAWNGKYAGKEALRYRDNPSSYAYGDIFGVKVYAHRAILALINGVWPPQDVDHINGDKTDNRLSNLRVVSRRGNAMNRMVGSHNRSGVMGVYWDKSRRKWAAEIFVGGIKTHIGRFESLNDARQARAKYEQALGFHANHGRSFTR